jgi:hypothetical protein
MGGVALVGASGYIGRNRAESGHQIVEPLSTAAGYGARGAAQKWASEMVWVVRVVHGRVHLIEPTHGDAGSRGEVGWFGHDLGLLPVSA